MSFSKTKKRTFCHNQTLEEKSLLMSVPQIDCRLPKIGLKDLPHINISEDLFFILLN